jgi:hypothetical protein
LSIQNHSKNWIVNFSTIDKVKKFVLISINNPQNSPLAFFSPQVLIIRAWGFSFQFLSLMDLGKRFKLPHSTLMEWMRKGLGNLEGFPRSTGLRKLIKTLNL